MCSSSAISTKLQVTAEQSLTGEYWIPPKKRYLISKGKGESPVRS